MASSSLSPAHFSNIVFAELETIETPRMREHSTEIIENYQQYKQFSIVLSSAFGIPTELIENTAAFSQSLYSSPSWRVLLIKIGNSPAAIATLHLSEFVASITCMGTAINYRNIGLQKSVINRCIAIAREAQCRIITSQVTPGSISELNTIKTGFKIRIIRRYA